MAITVQVYGAKELAAKFRNAASSLPSLLTDEMKDQMVMLADFVRTTKLSGDPLHRRSGRLSRSISGNSYREGKTVVGIVGSKGVPYAYVHENGGTFDIPEYTRRTGFNAAGERIALLSKMGLVRKQVKNIKTGIVKAHTATYPQRAFLKPSLDAKRSEIIQALRQVVQVVMHAS